MTLQVNNNTNTQLPNDINSRPVQVLAPDETTVTTIAVLAATQNRQALPTGAEIVEVATTGNCKFAFGDNTVDASAGTKRVICTGVYVYRVPTGATNWDAVTVDGSSGRITVAKLV